MEKEKNTVSFCISGVNLRCEGALVLVEKYNKLQCELNVIPEEYWNEPVLEVITGLVDRATIIKANKLALEPQMKSAAQTDGYELVFKNKYYTPSTVEFYPGFEFELLTRKYSTGIVEGDPEYKDVWNKVQFGVSSPAFDLWRGQAKKQEVDILVLFGQEYSKHLNEIGAPRTRVKYLDKEDIESLGFKFVAYDGDVISLEKRMKNDDYLFISYLPKDNTLIINVGTSCVFAGNIKNKSELIKVLQMIGVK